MYKIVPKSNIKRLEKDNKHKEFYIMKIALELAKEVDDESWKGLMKLHREDMELMNTPEGKEFKKIFER